LVCVVRSFKFRAARPLCPFVWSKEKRKKRLLVIVIVIVSTALTKSDWGPVFGCLCELRTTEPRALRQRFSKARGNGAREVIVTRGCCKAVPLQVLGRGSGCGSAEGRGE
jgi:hypothetical protein